VVWHALTSRETTAKFGYGAPVDIELTPGGSFRQLASDEMKVHGGLDVIADGEVVEVQAPERLVHTTRFLWDPETVAEGHTIVSYELETSASGATKLTVLHRLEGAPRDRRAGRWRGDGRRLARDSQRPQDLARDGQTTRGLSWAKDPPDPVKASCPASAS
jgi:uncharacterized protein YndB with AHSA1/START domain